MLKLSVEVEKDESRFVWLSCDLFALEDNNWAYSFYLQSIVVTGSNMS
jgi:hypothetical protein